MGAIASDFLAMSRLRLGKDWAEVAEPERGGEPGDQVLGSVPVHNAPGERRELRARETPPDVDFASVPPSQWAIHDRLENWANWCHGSSGREGSASPMFGGFRSDSWTEREYGAATNVPINPGDAAQIAKAVRALPDKHGRALQWRYPERARGAGNAARVLGVSKQGLADLVRDGRQMLVNRGV